MGTANPTDDVFYHLCRAHIDSFIAAAEMAGWLDGDRKVLIVGPTRDQMEWSGVDTLDIKEGCKITWDITRGPVPAMVAQYDTILCMEVLEHTIDPFEAVRTLRLLLKPGGILLASAPFNFRIHGPLPDAWRFTEHGWRILLKDFDNVKFDILDTPERFLMPMHYCVSAVCNKDANRDARTFEWRVINA